MKQTPSPVKRLWELTGTHRRAYMLSIILAMVAHRLYTVTGADQLVVVNQGRIEATGTHEELLKKCPLYKEMWLAHIGSRDEGGATA